MITRLKKMDQVMLTWSMYDPMLSSFRQDAYDYPTASMNAPWSSKFYYLDPPYQGTTGYKSNFTRDNLRDLMGALTGWKLTRGVIVSEAEPIMMEGWQHKQVAGPATHNCPFKSKKPEWLTYWSPSE
jgi:hypothetical protein